MDPIQIIKKYVEFFGKYQTELINASDKDCVKVEFFDISKFNPELADELLDRPEESLKAMEHAGEQVATDKKIKFRVCGMPKGSEVIIRQLRSEHLEKLWSIKGVIKRKSDVRPQITSARFECPSCGNIITILQVDRSFKEPKSCGCGRKGKFRELSKELVDGFSMVIEEFTDIVSAGSEIKRLNCFVKGPLSLPEIESKMFPGVKVEVIGILKPFMKQNKAGGKENQLDIFFDVNNIKILDTDYEDIKITQDDVEEFQELVRTGDTFEVLSSSMFSAVHGLDVIKKGLILQMLGGERKVLPSGYSARGDIHVLLIGDPGAGKSTMLKLVRSNAPRTRYVSGKGASGVGLTASVVRDELLGGYTLEAGALPLTHHGICIVDEFDKLAENETDAIHEALEEQTVSIAKASIQATLKCETTLLAAANPKYGRFDQMEPLSTQIALPPALITRFDLIFLFLDTPDEKQDALMAKKILSRNRVFKEPLMNTLKIKKFLAYAKQFHPTYSSKIEDYIAKFYTDIRNAPRKEGSAAVPISPRYIEVVRRLSEAHAKLNLRDRIELEDVDVAIELVMFTLKKLALDPETGELDIDMIATGYSSKNRSKKVKFFGVIDKLSEEVKQMPYEVLLERLEMVEFTRMEAEELIDKAKTSGEIYEPKQGFLQKMD